MSNAAEGPRESDTKASQCLGASWLVAHPTAIGLCKRFQLRRAGTTTAHSDSLVSFDEFNEFMGIDAHYALDERYPA